MAGVRDRVAIVTGAANGLGREIAQLLAREGARVVLGDLEPSGLERTVAAIVAAGGTALAVAGDLTEEEGARRKTPLPGPGEKPFTERPDRSGPRRA